MFHNLEVTSDDPLFPHFCSSRQGEPQARKQMEVADKSAVAANSKSKRISIGTKVVKGRKPMNQRYKSTKRQDEGFKAMAKV